MSNIPPHLKCPVCPVGEMKRIDPQDGLQLCTLIGIRPNSKGPQDWNSRRNRYHVDESNPFVVADRELKAFEEQFFETFENVNNQAELRELQNHLIMIFNAMTGRTFFMLKMYWGPQIKNIEIRAKLFAEVFLAVSKLESRLSELHDISHTLEFEEHEKLHLLYTDIALIESGADSRSWKESVYKSQFEDLLKRISLPDETVQTSRPKPKQ